MQLILGTLLGDGCLSRQKGASSPHFKLSITHSRKQLAYLEHKRDRLSPESKIYSDVSGFGGSRVRFVYSNLPNLNTISKIVLNEKYVKTVTSTWLSWLTWEGVAYWFMDDGCLITNKKWGSSEVRLCTNGFSWDEITLIQDHFSKLGLHFKSGSRFGSGREDQRRVLRLSNKESITFLKHVEPYIVPHFRYKIRSILGCNFMSSTEFCKNIQGFDLGKIAA
jgi:recombination protein RecA